MQQLIETEDVDIDSVRGPRHYLLRMCAVLVIVARYGIAFVVYIALELRRKIPAVTSDLWSTLILIQRSRGEGKQ